MAENGYIIEHWEKFFSPFFAFPHEAKLRGGEVKIFKTENEFLEFLILNPEVSYMWADHHQLLVTANHYNTVVQVLTINENGEGSLLQETIRPNPVLSPYSLLPQTRSDGEAVDIPEVWLTYTGGNHYEALLKDDHPLITEGSLKEREMLHKSNQPDDVKEINQSNVTENLCDKCQFSFSSKAALVKHSETSGHSQEVKIVRESKIACDSTNLVTELLDFELTEAQDGNDLKEERIAHKNTKKAMKSLEDELSKCKSELRIVKEEKERLKIENRDIKHVQELSRRQDKIKETILICDICEYPFKTQENLNSHKEKHKNETEEGETNQTCGICSTEFSSNNEFRNHIKIKHITQFNCENCDFQGSSKIILTKHLNLKHRNKEDQENGTLICSNCKDQFSSLWNLNNHMRDTHTKTQVFQLV